MPRAAAGLALLLALAGLSCAEMAPRPSRVTSGGGRATPPPLQVLASRACRDTHRREAVLRTQAEWQSFWAETGCATSPVPQVDFDRMVVVVAEDDTQPNGCYSVTVEAVDAVPGGGAKVRVVRTVPAATARCAMVIVHPLAAVAVARPSGPVTFEWRTESTGARP